MDDHHTVEHVGIALGQAFSEALGDKKGICRYGDTVLPMDEALIQAVLAARLLGCGEVMLQLGGVKFGSTAGDIGNRQYRTQNACDETEFFSRKVSYFISKSCWWEIFLAQIVNHLACVYTHRT